MENGRTGIIYCVTNKINGMKYIGLTSLSFCNRKAKHLSDTRKGDNLYFHRAIRKYGNENFIWEIIEKDIPIEYLCRKEREYIAKYNTYHNGYNLTKGGEGVFGLVRSNESRKKISKKLKGIKRTKEQIERWKENRKNNPITNEQREKMAKAHKGNKLKEETKRKLSCSLKGRIFTEEHKRKLSEKASERKLSEEQKIKISETRKNLERFKYEYKGEKRTLAQFAKVYGVRTNLLQQRLFVLGWDINRAIETPVSRCGRKKMKSNIDVYEERLFIYNRDGGLCRFCHKPVSFLEFERAHIIANAKWARRKYGYSVIDHPMNKACTHPGRCNDGMLITFRTAEAEELADKIRDELLKE